MYHQIHAITICAPVTDSENSCKKDAQSIISFSSVTLFLCFVCVIVSIHHDNLFGFYDYFCSKFSPCTVTAVLSQKRIILNDTIETIIHYLHNEYGCMGDRYSPKHYKCCMHVLRNMYTYISYMYMHVERSADKGLYVRGHRKRDLYLKIMF